MPTTSDPELAAILECLRRRPDWRAVVLEALLSDDLGAPASGMPQDELDALTRAHARLSGRLAALATQVQALTTQQGDADVARQALEAALADLAAEQQVMAEQITRLRDRVTFLAARQERHEARLANLAERLERLEALAEALLRRLRQPERDSHFPH